MLRLAQNSPSFRAWRLLYISIEKKTRALKAHRCWVHDLLVFALFIHKKAVAGREVDNRAWEYLPRDRSLKWKGHGSCTCRFL